MCQYLVRLDFAPASLLLILTFPMPPQSTDSRGARSCGSVIAGLKISFSGIVLFDYGLKMHSDLLTSKPLIAGTDPIIETNRGLPTWFVWPTILSGLVLLLYAPILRHLVAQWWSDPDYGHGFFVPLFSGYHPVASARALDES